MAHRKKTGRVPDREQILEFIADNPGRSGKREIARAFGIKGNAKIELKAVLKDMANDGLIEKRGKRLQRAGELPKVTVLDIVTRDGDGGLLAKPATWDETVNGKTPIVRIKPPKGSKSVTAGVGDRVLARTERAADHGIEYAARVIKRLERSRDAVLGVIRKQGDSYRLEPATKRQQELSINAGDLGDAGPGDLVEVSVLRASVHGLKRGRVTSVIGNINSEKAISAIAIHANGIPHVFPDQVLSEANSAKKISAATASHEDWQDIPLITIDPADAKDHDDAVFAEADPDNPDGHVVTVAIADVAWYVRSGTAMDREALLRGNSVYFPDRVIPMLPERISNDLCSLREGELRPSLAVKMWFDGAGRKIRHKFHRAIIKSHARLSYSEAQAAIDGKPNEKTEPILEPILSLLWDAWQCMKRGRSARSPLELDLPERKILLKPDGSVDRVIVPDRLDAHRLIEEFMIQANVAAAESLEQQKQKLIYRIHDAPSLAKLESLREFLKSANLSLARAGNIKASHFNAILDNVDGTDREELINQVVLRSQSQAEYSPDNIGHFGLNLMRYAHFTSPIRRYADLIVHRALIGALGLGKGALTPEQENNLDIIAADISDTERRAMSAERETIDRLIAGFLSEKIGERFSGRINGVTKAGLFITLAESGADGFIPISMISDEYYIYDEANHLVVGETSGLGFQIGQIVDVKLVEAAPLAGALRFEMLSEGKPFKKVARSSRTNQKPGQRFRRSRRRSERISSRKNRRG